MSQATINKLSVSAGFNWFKQGWGLFKKQPAKLAWITFVLFVIFILIAFIPFSNLLLPIFVPAIIGGFFLVTKKVDEDISVKVSDLFVIITNNDKYKSRKTLFLIGLVMILFNFIGIIAMGLSINHPIIFFVFTVLFLIFGLLFSMAMFFAIPLIVLDVISLTEAIKKSLDANMKNVGAWIVFSILYIFIAILGLIPLGLGMLVVYPLSFASIYVAYKQTFLINPHCL